MDQAVIQSSSLMVLDAYTDNPGTWLFHCHLTDHIQGGMMALFTVTGKAPQVQLNGQVGSTGAVLCERCGVSARLWTDDTAGIAE